MFALPPENATFLRHARIDGVYHYRGVGSASNVAFGLLDIDGIRLSTVMSQSVLPFTSLLDDRGFGSVADEPTTFVEASESDRRRRKRVLTRRLRKRTLNSQRGLIPIQMGEVLEPRSAFLQRCSLGCGLSPVSTARNPLGGKPGASSSTFLPRIVEDAFQVYEALGAETPVIEVAEELFGFDIQVIFVFLFLVLIFFLFFFFFFLFFVRFSTAALI